MSGKLFIFDLDKKKNFFEIQAHDQMLNCLDTAGGMIGQGPIEIVTGSRDGTVKLWDPRQLTPVLVLRPN